MCMRGGGGGGGGVGLGAGNSQRYKMKIPVQFLSTMQKSSNFIVGDTREQTHTKTKHCEKVKFS
jgi:hypothetical protein